MAEEHLNTTPEGQEAPENGGKGKPKDFSSEVNSQIDQLLSLAELLRLMEDTGAGAGKRDGFFYGIADIIEGCAARAQSMIDVTYDYMSGLGEKRALKKAKNYRESEAMLLRGTAREIEEMADYIGKMRQDPEFDFDLQTKIFISGTKEWRKRFEEFLEHIEAPAKAGEEAA